jgi:hypothetical protein
MFAYRRTTRECSVNQLNPRLRKAFEEYFIEHRMGSLAEEAQRCCETISDRENPGRLDGLLTGNPDSIDYLGLILTEKFLLWGRSGDRSGTKVFAADLKDVKIKSYKSRFSGERGIKIDAFLPEFKERAKGNLALGPEPAAQMFCEAAIKSAEQAKPPAGKRRIPWLPRRKD